LWLVPAALGAVMVWLAARPDPPLEPLGPPSASPPPPPRKLHDLDLTIVRGRDETPLASTSPDVEPQPGSEGDALYLVGTLSRERDLYVRIFLFDGQGAVREVPGGPFAWRAPGDGGSYPVLLLPLEGLAGDFRVRAFVAHEPFPLDRGAVIEAVRRSGRSPLDPAPLPLPPPPGRAGASFGELSVGVRRLTIRTGPP
jgi:hypothetical protein